MQMKRWIVALAAVIVVVTIAVAEADPPVAPNMDSISLDDLKRDVFFLADDDMRGRETCHPEIDIAAGYIRKRMQRAGVQPAGEANGYYQTVKFVHREWVERPELSITRGETRTSLAYKKDFVATSGPSTDAEISNAGVVFAGYAIKDEEQSYDDVAGLDLKGKVALILRFAPSTWNRDGRGRRFRRSSFLQSKERLLREAGAVGILMVTGPDSQDGNDNQRDLPSPEAAEKSPPLRLAGPTREAGDVPFLHITLGAADSLLGGSGRLLAAQRAFDKGDFSQRPDLASVSVTIKTRSREVHRECRNVVGKIEGELDEWIVFGAHHDHLGVGYFGSRDRPPKYGEVYNGADDNATGVACVLEIAEALAQSGVKPRRGFLFITFTGEEKGLLGARWYVRNPIVPNEKVVAMINIDMIGRIADKKMTLQGAAYSPLLQRLCQQSTVLYPSLEWTLSDRPPMPASDHWAFYGEAGVPIIFPWGGSNNLYHTTQDDPETINYEDMLTVVKMLYTFSWQLSNDPGKPGYKGPRREAHREDTGAPESPKEPAPRPPAPKEEEFSGGE